MILAALILPCFVTALPPVTYARPSDPQYVAMTHIRRLAAPLCEPLALVPLIGPPTDEVVAFLPEPAPFVPFLPAEGLWAMPYTEPYCECIAEASGGAYSAPGYAGGGFGAIGGGYVYASPVPSIAAVPEIEVAWTLLAGLACVMVWRRNRR